MRWRIALLCGLVLAGWFLPSGGADAARQKIAVLGIEARDEGDSRSRQKSAALAKTLTTELRSRATEGGYDLTPGAVKDLLELKLLSSCLDENATCMSAIGKELGADVVVYGHLEKGHAGYTVSLFRLETDTRIVRPIDVPRVGSGTEENIRKVAAAITLEAPAAPVVPAEPSRLVVSTNVPATIYVNGTPRGATADGQPLVVNDLVGSSVRLEVESPGRKRWENSIDLQRGTTEVTIALEPTTAAAPLVPPPTAETQERPGKTARVLFWTSLVATGAGVAAFTITGLQVRSIEKEQDQAITEWGTSYKANGVQFPGDACAEARHDGFAKLVDICDRGQNMATVTNVLIGVTAAAAVATAIFYWRGYLSTSDTEVPRQAKLQPIITPEVYKNGAGFGAVIQF